MPKDNPGAYKVIPPKRKPLKKPKPVKKPAPKPRPLPVSPTVKDLKELLKARREKVKAKK